MRIITYSTRSPVWNKPFIFEQWKRVEHPLIPYADGPVYISTCGRVVNENKQEIIVPWQEVQKNKNRINLFIDYNITDGNGCNIGRRHITVCRAIMLLFCPISNPEKYEVNHMDGNTMNNFIYNLSWCTKQENIQFAYMNGQMSYHDKDGNRVVKSILMPDQVDNIRRLLCKGLTINQISIQTGVKYKQIYDIATGRTYNYNNNNDQNIYVYSEGISGDRMEYMFPNLNLSDGFFPCPNTPGIKYITYKNDPIHYTPAKEKRKYTRGSVFQQISRDRLNIIFNMLYDGYMCCDIADATNCDGGTIKAIQQGVLYNEQYIEFLKERNGDNMSS